MQSDIDGTYKKKKDGDIRGCVSFSYMVPQCILSILPIVYEKEIRGMQSECGHAFRSPAKYTCTHVHAVVLWKTWRDVDCRRRASSAESSRRIRDDMYKVTVCIRFAYGQRFPSRIVYGIESTATATSTR